MPLRLTRSDQHKKIIRRPKIRTSLRLSQPTTPSRNLRRARLWLIGAALFATSVTVASIPMNSPVVRPTTMRPATPTPELNDMFRLVSRWGLATALAFDREASTTTRALNTAPRPTVPWRNTRRSVMEAIDRTQGFIPAAHSQQTNLGADGQETRETDIRQVHVTVRIHRSLFEDAADAGLSDSLILAFVQIFGWDVDFALDIEPGDRFTVIYEVKYWRGKKVADGEIVAAELINSGRVYRAVRFPGAGGKMEYYSVTGRNLRRPFLRTPVKFSRVSSEFAKARFHPVLKVWRAHNGVDYVAPVGTPVYATASGRVIWRGWSGSYGKTIVIDHGDSYTTLYGHLDDYRPDLRTGQYVKQGAVIGYVGQTGLTTGPHLHYEFRVNGQHRNPLTLDFPQQDAVPVGKREDFVRVARHWIARLDIMSGRVVAIR
jgi:murein DD-endopeptidase MepM/ murein hydrolase activator NlpD